MYEEDRHETATEAVQVAVNRQHGWGPAWQMARQPHPEHERPCVQNKSSPALLSEHPQTQIPKVKTFDN